jgi:hypothetical protein
MNKEMELLDVEIAKTKIKVNDTSVGISLLGVFFLALIPVFYSIMGMYDYTLQDVQLPLIFSTAIIFLATMLAVLHWEQNTQKLKKLYAQKIDMINKADVKEETKEKIADIHKKKR